MIVMERERIGLELHVMEEWAPAGPTFWEIRAPEEREGVQLKDRTKGREGNVDGASVVTVERWRQSSCPEKAATINYMMTEQTRNMP